METRLWKEGSTGAASQYNGREKEHWMRRGLRPCRGQHRRVRGLYDDYIFWMLELKGEG